VNGVFPDTGSSLYYLPIVFCCPDPQKSDWYVANVIRLPSDAFQVLMRFVIAYTLIFDLSAYGRKRGFTEGQKNGDFCRQQHGSDMSDVMISTGR
jgi:hypothetical protein